jgi:hypothetical protein
MIHQILLPLIRFLSRFEFDKNSKIAYCLAVLFNRHAIFVFNDNKTISLIENH